ncbi:MAG: SPOCS domain-containing protein [Oscillospiraceae bacterium]
MEETSKTAVFIDEIIFDGQTEQGVELDYVLPDYCPDIFKILSCSLTPKIVSYSVSSDGKLSLDGVVYIKALYLAENSSDVFCIDQRYTYSKLIDITRKDAVSPWLTFEMKQDYCTCRAVSPRRIDVRGAVSCRIKAESCRENKLGDIPEGLQVKSRAVTCCGRTLYAKKQILSSEEIETGSAGVAFIMQSSACPKITDVRIVADKAVVKGVVIVSALYGLPNAESSGCSEAEKMTAEIPISAILDIAGITDEHVTVPTLNILDFELIPKTDSGIISCRISAECSAKAWKAEKASFPVDVYSTEYETEFLTNTLRLNTSPRQLSQTLTLKMNVTAENFEIRSVWDCRAEIKNPVLRAGENGEPEFSGMLCGSVYGKNAEGAPFYLEKQEAFRQVIPVSDITENTAAQFAAKITGTDFSIKSDGAIELSALTELKGVLCDVVTADAVSEVTVREDKPKAKNDEFALRICYTDEQSDCWSIAKAYNTTVKALMEENDISDEQAALSGMIIIPTV